MSDRIWEDLAEMKKKLSQYVDKGRVTGHAEVKEEPVIAVKPDVFKIRPLKKVSGYEGRFLAVDCSTRTLKRANCWGIYLMRVAYTYIRERKPEWGYKESIHTAIGGADKRRTELRDKRFELESEMALSLIYAPHVGRSPDHVDYFLLDGGSFFGEKRGFKVALYEKCRELGINLLTISKRSPTLNDDVGRDFIATVSTLSPYSIWVYYPVEKTNKDKHLYGDVSVIKICEDSPRAFRCDIMDYLTNREMDELLSPLTSVSEDPRCLGYPIPLYLAHEFSASSESMLLHHYDQVEKELGNAGLLDVLRREELTCSFVDELHGVRHAYEREYWDEYV